MALDFNVYQLEMRMNISTKDGNALDAEQLVQFISTAKKSVRFYLKFY